MAEEAMKNNDSSVQDEWGQICSQLKMEFGETAFDSWLKPLSVGTYNNGVMNICVPTAFMKNWGLSAPGACPTATGTTPMMTCIS